MNPVIAKKMPLEYLALWEVSRKKQIGKSTLNNELKSNVQNHRNKFRARGFDILGSKFENFGNKGGWAKHKITELAQAVYHDKKPDNINLGQWISVEIELVMPSREAEGDFVLFIRKNGLTKFTTIKDDGSIKLRRCECEEVYNEDTEEHEVEHESDCRADARNAYGKEIVFTFQYGQFDMLKAMCNKLNQLGCTVNKTCGLHVHFDMRHMGTARKMSVVAQRVAKVVPALKQILPASRQDNRFCNTVINRLSDNGRGNGRYAFVNVQAYERHKTLEIRGHSGTTDGDKIVQWIKIIKTVMDKPNRSEIGTVQALIEKVKFEPETIVYLLQRQAKFAKAPMVTDDVSNDNQSAESGQPDLTSLRFITDANGNNVLQIGLELLSGIDAEVIRRMGIQVTEQSAVA